MFLKRVSLFLLLLVWGLVACGGQNEPAVTSVAVAPTTMASSETATTSGETATAVFPTAVPDPTVIPATEQPAVAQPTSEESQQPGPTMAFGVSYQADATLADSLEATIMEAVPPGGPESSGFETGPEHIAFTFVNSYAADWTIWQQAVNTPTQPQLFIFPLDAYALMTQTANEQIGQLNDILRDRPDLPNGALPHLPFPNGSQDIQAQLTYLTFQNGEGIRYLTQVSQEMRPVTNESLYYTFQGVTADRAFYVAVFFPVHNENLPAAGSDVDITALANDWPTYLAQTTADLNAASSTTFTPDLAHLDAFVQSLLVQPSAELSTATTADIFCGDIARPAILASTANGFAISNPLTGENCPFLLPSGINTISEFKDGNAYAFHVDEQGGLHVMQLTGDGIVQELSFMLPPEGEDIYDIALSDDGRQLIWSTVSRQGDQVTSNLWLADLDGQNQGQLVADWVATSKVIEPIRSEGDTVYFTLQPEGIGGIWNAFNGRYDSLYSISAGSDPRKIFACEDYNLLLCIGDISPDFSTLVYTDYVNSSLNILNIDGTPKATVALTDDYSGYPTYLDNGDLVYYTAVLHAEENSIPLAQPGTLYQLAAPYTGTAREIISGNGVMFPVTPFDADHLIINYSDETGQWGNALLTLSDGTIAPLQPWPGTFFSALLTAN